MSGFSADWLAMREPYDQRARNHDVLVTLKTAFSHLPSMSVVDLACGTGATRRAIVNELPRPQNWKLVDNDLSLLARAAAAPAPAGCTTRTVPIDLVRDLEVALDGACDLVTCSALLDLVSEQWLDRLVTECAARRLPLYAALTYDGRVTLEPSDRMDEIIIDAVNHHQMSDKGFGPALGPVASAALSNGFRALGYEVDEGPADWNVAPADADMQRSTFTQWAMAAKEMGGMSVTNVASWLERRLELVAAGKSRIVIGHTDVLARPMMRR
jgi:hypothetical protein